jgi:hypothetical protein
LAITRLHTHLLGISAVRKVHTISIYAGLVDKGSNEQRKRKEGRDKCPIRDKDRNDQALRRFKYKISTRIERA